MASNADYFDPKGQLRLFLVCHPGLEQWLGEELVELGYPSHRVIGGGVELDGSWQDIAFLNYWVRGATRVLVRIAEFSAVHFSQLDKRSRQIAWQDWLAKGSQVIVEATAKRSKLYHSKGIAQRVGGAAIAALSTREDDSSTVTVHVRLVNDWCQVSLDTSGEPLYKRGGKQEIGKAPMRETMATLFLRAARFDPQRPLFDPMCGSGTFVLEAAGRASGQVAAANRGFAYQLWPSTVDIDTGALKGSDVLLNPVRGDSPMMYGSDRDAGAAKRATANAERLGVAHMCQFARQSVSEVRPLTSKPGLMIVNPPYGDRLGNKARLAGLYASFGQVMRDRFAGWRVALITTEAGLAAACNLPFNKPGPVVSHGGLKVRLWQTETL